MSLLFRDRTETRGVRLPADVVERMQADYTGIMSVDSDSALRHDTVWSCRTAIAQDVSMMPVDVIRYVGKTRQDEPAPQIIAAPSVYASPLDWRYQIIDSWLADGNAWGLVTETTMNGRYPARIELKANKQISIIAVGGRMEFRVDNVKHDLWPVGDLWHAPAFTIAGRFLGLSPIGYHAVTIGAGIAAEQFGADYFNRGGHPTAILAPEKDPGVDGAKGIKAAFMKATRGREPAVLPQSIKYTQVQTNPGDSQFIETMSYTAAQICRIYREDPADHGVAVTGSVTYANRSDADLARFKRRQFWVVKLQDVLTDMVPEPVKVRLNVNASLMMTATERHHLHKLRLDSRTQTINNVLQLEDETPFGKEFDIPGIPVDDKVRGQTPATPQGSTP